MNCAAPAYWIPISDGFVPAGPARLCFNHLQDDGMDIAKSYFVRVHPENKLTTLTFDTF